MKKLQEDKRHFLISLHEKQKIEASKRQVAKRTGCNSQQETKDSDGRFGSFLGAKESITWDKIRRQRTIRRRREGKGSTLPRKKRKERKGRGRDVAMALVLRLLHAGEGASLLSFPLLPKSTAKHA
jgi:hypothetical protein